jgi:hypothetical protein
MLEAFPSKETLKWIFNVLCKFMKVLSRKEGKSFKVFLSGFPEDLCSAKEEKQNLFQQIMLN